MSRSLPQHVWPEADHAAWAAAFADGDVFDGRGPCAHWSARTRAHAAWAYGRWLAWLEETEAMGLAMPPAERLAPERLRRFVLQLQAEVSPSSVHIYLDKLAGAARAVAPHEDWSWMRGLVRRLGHAATPRRKPVAGAQDLLALGLRLMAMAELSSLDGWREYRDGLLIALLTLRPLRRANLAALRIGGQLRRTGEGWTLAFDAEEMKGREPYEAPWPPLIASQLEQYLRGVRPRFPGADRHDGLWASSRGRPLGDQRIADMVTARTEVALGRRVNLHAFRSIAASTLALEAPEQAAAARDLLGHARLSTTEKHYLRAGPRRAGRAYQAIVADLLDAQAPRARRPAELTETVR